MALTLVSRTRPLSLSPRMTACVDGPQPGGLYLSVNLSCRERRMSQKLLNRPQIGSSLEQMGGEGVAQPVRRGPGLHGRVPSPDAQPAAHIGGREAPPRLRQEQRGLVLPSRRAGAAGGAERRAATLGVGAQRLERVLADGHHAGLAALALDPHLLVVVVERREIEVDELFGA